LGPQRKERIWALSVEERMALGGERREGRRPQKARHGGYGERKPDAVRRKENEIIHSRRGARAQADRGTTTEKKPKRCGRNGLAGQHHIGEKRGGGESTATKREKETRPTLTESTWSWSDQVPCTTSPPAPQKTKKKQPQREKTPQKRCFVMVAVFFDNEASFFLQDLKKGGKAAPNFLSAGEVRGTPCVAKNDDAERGPLRQGGRSGGQITIGFSALRLKKGPVLMGGEKNRGFSAFFL